MFSSFFREITSFAEFCTFCSELTLKRNLVKAYCEIKQVQKVLWTRKAPACLLTLLYAYGERHLCMNIHHYAPPCIVLQQAAAMHAALHALRRQYTAQYREHLIRQLLIY